MDATCLYCNKEMTRETWEDGGYTQVGHPVCSPECAQKLVEAFKASKVAVTPASLKPSFTYGR